MTVSLCRSNASRGRKPVTVVFGTGGLLRLALVVWSWRGLVARLSICPLENSPVLLESIMAPAEEIAITISDGREGERQEPHPFLEYDQTYDWNIFTKHHYSNVLLIPSVRFLIVSGFRYTSFLPPTCHTARGGCAFKRHHLAANCLPDASARWTAPGLSRYVAAISWEKPASI